MRSQVIGLVVVGLALPFVASEAHADRYVHGHFRSNGTYVAPHMRSNADGNFWNNWSTVGNVNPYTGMHGRKTSPNHYRATYPSSWSPAPAITAASARQDLNASLSTCALSTSTNPGTATPLETSNYDPIAEARAIEARAAAEARAAEARAAEQVRREAELRAELARRKEIETQMRWTADAKIRADAQQRRAEWQNREVVIQAEARAQFEAEVASRRVQWQIDESWRKQAALVALQQNISDCRRQWDEYLAKAEEAELADRAESAERVAEAHARVKARYAGDGRQAIRDKQRARADAWSSAQRDVRERRAAETRLAARSSAEAQYQASAIARLKTEEADRRAIWQRELLAARTDLDRQAQQRLAAFEREESAMVAAAKAQAEEQLLRSKEEWAKLPPGTAEPDSNLSDRTTSIPPLTVSAGLLASLLTAVGTFARLRS